MSRHGCLVCSDSLPLIAWHTVPLDAYHLLSTNTKRSRVLLSPLAWFSAAQRQTPGCMRALNGVLPHAHGEGPWSAALPGLGSVRWHWTVLPRDSRFITVLPLPSSLLLKHRHNRSSPSPYKKNSICGRKLDASPLSPTCPHSSLFLHLEL